MTDSSSSSSYSTLNSSILATCRNRVVLLSGCGGGCDVYGAAFLVNQIKQAGAKKVILANLSFTSSFNLHKNGKCVLGPDLCYKIFPNTVDMSSEEAIEKNENLATDYFPEAMMANACQHPCYAFRGGYMTIQQIADSHRAMLKEEGLLVAASDNNEKQEDENDENDETEKAILFLVDGGFDAFLDGTETGLATPVEDMMHIKAVQSLMPKFYDAEKSFLCSIGANVDGAHGMIETEMVARVQELKKKGALLWSRDLCLNNNSEKKTDDEDDNHKEIDKHAKFYCDVVDQSIPVQTIVQSLAVAAIKGNRGFHTPHHLAPRIGRNKIPLSQWTSTFFIFDFNKVANDIKYLDKVKVEDDAHGFMVALSEFRKSIGKRH